MRARALVAALLLAALAWPSGAEDRWPDTSGGIGVNIPTDTDSDGRADYILVGDLDGDGTLEIEDIQAAHDRLRVSSDENAAAGAKPDLTVSLTDASCSGATACVLRTVGSWITDGFTNSLSVRISGFETYTTGRTILGAAVDTACTATGGAAAGPDCFTRPSGSFVTDGFTVGMRLYPYYFKEVLNGGTVNSKVLTVAAVTALEMEVNCESVAAGTTGCLTTAGNRAGRWIVSPGVNGNYTVDASVAITDAILPLSAEPPKAEAVTPTGQGAPTTSRNMPVVSDTHPITLELVTGTYVAPGTISPYSVSAQLQLTSYTTMRGQGGTKIACDSDTLQVSCISGPRVQWYPGYVTDVHLSDFELDGGWDVGANTVYAIGVDMGGFENSTVDSLVIHDTGHACVHIFNGSWNRITDVSCYRAGNWDTLVTATTQAGFYNFSGQLATATISIGNEWIDNSSSLTPDGFHFRRDDAADEVALAVVRGGTVSESQSGVAMGIRGTRDLVIDGVRMFRAGPISFDTNAAAYGDLSSSYGTTIRNVDIFQPSHGATLAAGFQLTDFHDRVFVDNMRIKGGSGGSLPCMRIDQPTRGALFRNVTLDDCPGSSFLLQGVDQGTQYESSADAAITFEGFTIRSGDDADAFATNRDGILASFDVAHFIMRNFVIEGMTGNALDFQRCYDCTFENGLITGVQPRFIGIGAELAWANTITCDYAHENWYLITTDASGVNDCTFASGTGASQSECYCDGAGTWTAMTVSGANQDVVTFSDGIEDSVIRNVTVKDARDADGISITGSSINTVYQNIRCENTGAWGGLGDMNDCLVSDANASNAGNHIDGLSCTGLDEQCFAWNAGAEPTATAGSYDDFDFSSQFPIAANIGGDADCACTTGQLGQVAGTDGLVVCEAALWVNK